jgi:ferredoxin
MVLMPLVLFTTKEAARRDLGVADVNDISILGEKLADVIGRPFILPKASASLKIPQPVIELARKLIKYYPCVDQDNCIRCAVCLQACPKKAISIKKERITIDRSKCISCFCCQEACPASAMKIEKSLFTKLIGL